MLVLQRRVGQKIYLEDKEGNLITIMLTDLRKQFAKIGIEATAQYTIKREELRNDGRTIRNR